MTDLLHQPDDAPGRPAIAWLRDDLRLADNPALTAAAAAGPVIVVVVRDEVSPGVRPLGGAARWWWHHSLEALGRDLEQRDVPLVLQSGPAGDVIADLARATGAREVHWNRRYDPAGMAVDAALKSRLKAAGIQVESHHANLLFEPFAISTGDGRPYRVFTPFWRACLSAPPPRPPVPAPVAMTGWPGALEGESLADWRLLPVRPNWAAEFADHWAPGEHGARAALDRFLAGPIRTYAEERDRPDLERTSRLSPHLRFGEISPFTVWQAARDLARDAPATDTAKFLAEIGWREFCWHLTFHFGDLSTGNFNPSFNGFGWRDDPDLVQAWAAGRTGIPLVDAGMRQLWRTGWMHNRVRMVAASFLAKHLLQHWRVGEAWFWDTLVDADIANNPAGWQWVAGTGADAAPYFRIFNPVTQGEKFDPDGAYIRRWVPELAHLAGKATHHPQDGLLSPGYPRPIVDLAEGRDRALEALATLRRKDSG